MGLVLKVPELGGVCPSLVSPPPPLLQFFNKGLQTYDHKFGVPHSKWAPHDGNRKYRCQQYMRTKNQYPERHKPYDGHHFIRKSTAKRGRTITDIPFEICQSEPGQFETLQSVRNRHQAQREQDASNEVIEPNEPATKQKPQPLAPRHMTTTNVLEGTSKSANAASCAGRSSEVNRALT